MSAVGVAENKVKFCCLASI